ncbi:MAG: hypothetical protein AAF633_23855, partial [Chloroflexota bacterium]
EIICWGVVTGRKPLNLSQSVSPGTATEGHADQFDPAELIDQQPPSFSKQGVVFSQNDAEFGSFGNHGSFHSTLQNEQKAATRGLFNSLKYGVRFTKPLKTKAKSIQSAYKADILLLR